MLKIENITNEQEEVPMRYRKLGKTHIEISEMTFGCWELGGGQWEKQSDEVNIEAIQKAFELGIHTFDTAEGDGKGHSEEVVRMGLDGKRKECVISTKVSPEHLKPEDVRSAAENSLIRLGTDYLDINVKAVEVELTDDELQQLSDISTRVIQGIDG